MNLCLIFLTLLVLFNRGKYLNTISAESVPNLEENKLEDLEPADNVTSTATGFLKSQNYLDEFYTKETDAKIRRRINSWRPEKGGNIWELSGLLEGDIQSPRNNRNGLRNPAARWPCGIIPYTLEDGCFNTAQITTIYEAIKEYHTSTCLRFFPKTEADENYIEFTSRYAGCWAPVGVQGGKQNVNLQAPGCLYYATVLHEIMHAIGFYHSHSVSTRDDYVQINWENIRKGQGHNFRKFSEDQVTDYGVPYDYYSILHYSSTAFSKNGNATIEPRYPGHTVGRAKHLSSGDLEKIKKMYGEECEKRCERDFESI